ncbi:MAG: hypothetical protein SAK29_23190 [Scytonema sp. PMC 1069.18]|nr:hypothetical protein [Scytonema sp. PMC 1069.18]MEC4887779.1 hypothetical protein [Scytonema sp. PMC 1070.18]
MIALKTEFSNWGRERYDPNKELKGETMARAYLKNGETVEVDFDHIEDFLRENKDNIKPIRVKRRGPMVESLETLQEDQATPPYLTVNNHG